MAPESHGRHTSQGQVDNDENQIITIKKNNNAMGPPPSTLAAQLVENISTSARSSRPDETQELKRLFTIIERVKNQPDLLTTPAERAEHNHMLIYVYARVVLEGLRWDDLFADHAKLRAEALMALNFLRVTVRETPAVLAHRIGGGERFLFRGEEPLWLWLLPKVLKTLAHPQCDALTSTTEEFIQFLVVTFCQSAALLEDAPVFVSYIQHLVESESGLRILRLGETTYLYCDSYSKCTPGHATFTS